MNRPMKRPVVTGSILSQFSEPVLTQYSPYATLPSELSRFLDQLAKVRFPVNSKRELLEKLGGPETPVFVGENVVEARQALMFLPAHMFPVADQANLAEKLSDYYASRAPRQRREPISQEEIRGLATRFVNENPDFLMAAAKAVRHLSEADNEKDSDSDAIAARFLKKSQALIDTVGGAFGSVARLRAKTREDLQPRESPSAKKRRGGGEAGGEEKPTSV